MSAIKSDVIFFNKILKEERDYWLNKLSKDEDASNFILDYRRSGQDSKETNAVAFELNEKVYKKLCKVASQSSFLIYTVLLSTLKLCLHTYTGKNRIIVGSPPIKERSEGNDRANMLAIVDELNEQMPFHQLLLSVRESLLEAYKRQRYPLGRLLMDLEVSGAENKCPLFDVAMSFADIHDQMIDASNDITITFSKEEERLTGRVNYNTNLFRKETIEYFRSHFEHLLSQAVTETSKRICEFEVLTDKERQKLLCEWNGSDGEDGRDCCIHEMFERQAENGQDVIAIVFEECQITYRQLNIQVNKLARHLQTVDGSPEMRVGVFLNRSPEMIVAILAVLKSGGAYVPFDPSYPREKLAFMLEDARIRVLITERSLIGGLPAHLAHVVLIDEQEEYIAGEVSENLPRSIDSDNLAYVIYTSGSSGKPKGVMIHHRALADRVEMLIQAYELHSHCRLLQFVSLSFDASAEEVFPTLASGATLVICRNPTEIPVTRFLEECERLQITALHIPPAYWYQFIDQLSPPKQYLPQSVSIFITGGESPSVEKLVSLMRLRKHDHRLILAYGPTETTITSAIHQLPSNPEKVSCLSRIPIGRPIENTQIYVLDERIKPSPIGVSGELHIAGISLARGYLNLANMTAEKFLPDPFTTRPGRRLYRTGDWARWTSEGNLEFLGRTDDQIKLRGFRIELGEIETVLAEHPNVKQSVLIVREGQPGETSLIAYVTGQQQDLNVDSLRSYLSERLPNYMVPNVFMIIEAFPINANGKIDRKALPAPRQGYRGSEQPFVASRSAVEMTITGIWSEIIGIETVGVFDNFFALGGHSLLATRVLTRIREAFGVDIPLHTLFKAPTVANLAMAVEEEQRRQGQEKSFDQILHEIEHLSPDDVQHSLSREMQWYQDGVA